MAATAQYRKSINPLQPIPVTTIPPQLLAALPSGMAVTIIAPPSETLGVPDAPLPILNGSTWAKADGIAKLEQDMRICLLTNIGRRLNQPDYGSLLPRLIFEAWGPTLKQELFIATQTALQTWVPAVIVQNVSLDSSNINNNMIKVIIQYTVAGTNAKQTLVLDLDANNTVKLPPTTYTLGGKLIGQLRT